MVQLAHNNWDLKANKYLTRSSTILLVTTCENHSRGEDLTMYKPWTKNPSQCSPSNQQFLILLPFICLVLYCMPTCCRWRRNCPFKSRCRKKEHIRCIICVIPDPVNLIDIAAKENILLTWLFHLSTFSNSTPLQYVHGVWRNRLFWCSIYLRLGNYKGIKLDLLL